MQGGAPDFEAALSDSGHQTAAAACSTIINLIRCWSLLFILCGCLLRALEALEPRLSSIRILVQRIRLLQRRVWAPAAALPPAVLAI